MPGAIQSFSLNPHKWRMKADQAGAVGERVGVQGAGDRGHLDVGRRNRSVRARRESTHATHSSRAVSRQDGELQPVHSRQYSSEDKLIKIVDEPNEAITVQYTDEDGQREPGRVHI